MLVEDEEHTAILLQDYLQTIGYQVERIEDGNDFLDRVRSQQPDLILLDLELVGDFQGWDLLNNLRQQPDLQDLAVVMMMPKKTTGEHASITYQQEARLKQPGANEYISKPIGIVQLESIIMRYLS